MTPQPIAPQYLSLRPLDPLFFRSGLPFALAEDNLAASHFPPYPSVLAGALRTAYARQAGLPVEKIPAATQDLRIDRIAYHLDGRQLWLPLPLDYVQPKIQADPAHPRATLLQLQENPIALAGWLSSRPQKGSFAPAPDVTGKPRIVESIEDGLIAVEELLDYLEGKPPTELEAGWTRWSDHLLTEAKLGIEREDATRSAKEGRIYRVAMSRIPEQADIIVRLHGLDFSPWPEGVLKLGGEGKLAAYQLVSPDEIRSLTDLEQLHSEPTTRFKVYLSTPGVFSHPEGIPTLEPHLPSAGRIDFLGACTGRALSIGGWDLQARTPKAMTKAAPAGAIYAFETDQPLDLGPLQGICLSDIGPDQGFGRAFFAPL